MWDRKICAPPIHICTFFVWLQSFGVGLARHAGVMATTPSALHVARKVLLVVIVRSG
jgi:hypothetical protein